MNDPQLSMLYVEIGRDAYAGMTDAEIASALNEVGTATRRAVSLAEVLA